jgi:hypothetical protein
VGLLARDCGSGVGHWGGSGRADTVRGGAVRYWAFGREWGAVIRVDNSSFVLVYIIAFRGFVLSRLKMSVARANA